MPRLDAGNEEAVVIESKASVEVQREAESAGWIPPARYKGEPEAFRDADEYLERAQTVLPIVNKKLAETRSELAAERQARAALEATLRATQTAVAALEEAHAEDVKEQVERARAEVKAQLKLASENGDHEAIAQLTTELVDLNQAEKEAQARDIAAKEKVKEPITGGQPPALTAEFKEWLARNDSWFGPDKRKTRMAMLIATEIREELARAGTQMPEADFLRRVDTELEASGEPPTGKVDGGSRGTSRGNGGKSFSDLPREAKDACHEFNGRLVGPNKKYKSVGDWEKAYAARHFAQQEDRR